jgi:hypothetical protein
VEHNRVPPVCLRRRRLPRVATPATKSAPRPLPLLVPSAARQEQPPLELPPFDVPASVMPAPLLLAADALLPAAPSLLLADPLLPAPAPLLLLLLLLLSAGDPPLSASVPLLLLLLLLLVAPLLLLVEPPLLPPASNGVPPSDGFWPSCAKAVEGGVAPPTVFTMRLSNCALWLARVPSPTEPDLKVESLIENT